MFCVFVGKHHVLYVQQLGGLSTVAVLCGNVLGLSNFMVSSLSPCICSCTMLSNMYAKCVHVLLSSIGLATHAFLPFGNIILNLVFPERKYKKYLYELTLDNKYTEQSYFTNQAFQLLAYHQVIVQTVHNYSQQQEQA